MPGPVCHIASTKSQLAYGLLGAINANRLAVYAESAIYPDVGGVEANAGRRELLAQAQAAIYALRANRQMLFSVREAQGHSLP